METTVETTIDDLSEKYHVSRFQLMEHLNISFKNGKYFYRGVSYDTYSRALKVADISLESKQENGVKNKSAELMDDTKLTNEELKWKKSINKKRIILVVLMVFYVPLGGVIHTITKSNSITIPIVILHFFVIACLSINIFSSTCPRCGKKFFFTIAFKNHFSNKCLHCGFSLI